MPDKRVLRVLDANLNRCREGLRVLEDTARFVWSDPSLFRAYRGQRHDLEKATRGLYPQLVGSRGSEKDEGRHIRENGRSGIAAIVAANFRRCEESLRVLEEYGKLFSGSAGHRFKRIRFKMYDLEKNAVQKRKMK